MSIQPGSSLGPYEIVAPLGAGGMGEVYRARDTRLNREVAIKILPSHLASNPESRARFEREARAVSSLNHPHICTLHDVGRDGEIDYLVMELLEGQTLADRLQRGPLPLEELLKRGIEIAGALDAAHRRGIVHRDLKPGNIILTRTGAKLLDFGLARSEALAAPAGSLTMSPTMTRPLTSEGAIVGTFQYMAPEQLEGKEADARTDIFALGTVLYEMAAGKRAFDGRSHASLIGAIMSAQPPSLKEAGAIVSPGLERLVRACLAKDPEDRIQSARDVAMQLRWIAEGEEGARVAAPAAEAAGTARWWRVAAAALAATSVLLALALLFRPAGAGAASPRAQRFQILPPAGISWRPWNSVALSPDGTQLVYYALDLKGSEGLYLRPIDAPGAQRLPGTDRGNPSFPFWSPDGRRIGFFADGELKVLEIGSAAPLTLCDAPDGRGGSWGSDDTILFSPRPGVGLMKVSAAGGEPAPVLTPGPEESGGQMWPLRLPGGRHFLYLAVGDQSNDSWMTLGELGSPSTRRLFEADSGALYDPSERIVFRRDGALVAQRLEASTWLPVGSPELISPAVSINRDSWYAPITLSKTGLLVFRSGTDSRARRVTWHDRRGGLTGEVGTQGEIAAPALAPDGARLVLAWAEAAGAPLDLWIHDLATKARSRLTFGDEVEGDPIWSADGTQIYYSARRGGLRGIYAKPADGSREERLVLGQPDRDVPEVFLSDVSSDGRHLVYDRLTKGRADLWLAPLDGAGSPGPLVEGSASEGVAKFSPDGRWLAYTSDESGRPEIYVRSVEAGGGRWQISTAGGVQPRWRRDGRELYYVGIDRMLMAVRVDPRAAAFSAGSPEPLFLTPLPAVPNEYRYDVTPDGQRFAVVSSTAEEGSVPADAIVNWTSVLRREVSR